MPVVQITSDTIGFLFIVTDGPNFVIFWLASSHGKKEEIFRPDGLMRLCHVGYSKILATLNVVKFLPANKSQQSYKHKAVGYPSYTRLPDK